MMGPLKVRNFRLLFIAHGISTSGSFMQDIAQAWLVLHLSRSYMDLGLVVCLQYLPMLFFGAWGGVFADRFDRRRLLFMTDAVGGVLALTLAILVLTNSVHLWEIYVLALLVGCTSLVNEPAGQSILGELVGEDLLPKAVGLIVSLVSIARVVGPIAAGILLATVSYGPCFIVNAATYLVSLACLAAIRPAEMFSVAHISRQHGQVREGLRHVRENQNLRVTLILLAIMGIFCFNFIVTLSVLAKGALSLESAGVAILFAAWGLGGGFGSLLAARKSTPDLRRLGWLGVLFGVSVLVLAASPTLAVAAGISTGVGVLTFWFVSSSADLLQVWSQPEMRGRVMALWFVVLWGSYPIGSPLMTWVAENEGPRAPLVLCGVAAVVSCGTWLLWAHRHPHTSTSVS